MLGKLVGLAAMATLVMAQGPDTQFSVTGTVVNSVTGEGIRRALVRLNGPGNYHAFTDMAGKFEIANVPAGVYVATAQRPGFDSQVNGVMPTADSVKVDANTQPIAIKLMPQGQIEGRVTDENGDPIQGVFIQVSEDRVMNGRKTRVNAASANTEEDGSYEIDGLQAGHYTLHSNAGFEWFNGAATVPRLHLPSYFPGVPDRGSAQVIDLGAGQTFTADFRLRTVPAYRVSGFAGPAANMVSVSVLDSEGEPTGLNGGGTGKTGQWTLLAPAGQWTLQAVSWSPSGMQYQGEIPIQVTDHPIKGLQIPMLSLATVSVRTHGADDAVLQPVMLRNVNGQDFYPLSQGSPPNSLSFLSLPPGRYKARVPPGPACVASVSAGGTDLSQDDYIVSAGTDPPPIDVEVSKDCGTISFQAPASGAASGMAIVTSDSRIFDPRVSPLNFSGGGLQLGSLPPGRYHLYHVASVEGLEYTNPEVMSHFSAQEIDLQANENKQVTLAAGDLAER